MMAHEWRGSVWFVRGVDSYNKDEDRWCRHSPNLPLRKVKNTHDEITHLQCLKCGRLFENIHPITAEAIIRGRDDQIQILEEQMEGV